MSHKPLFQISCKPNVKLPILEFKDVYKIHRQIIMPPFALLRKAPRGTLRTFVTGDGAPREALRIAKSEVWWAGRAPSATPQDKFEPHGLPGGACAEHSEAHSNEWWCGLYNVRTEIVETKQALQEAFSVLQLGI